MNKRLIRFSISTAAVLVLAAGCSSSGSPADVPGPEMSPSSVPSVSMTHSPDHSPTTTTVAPDTTEAAALRATLTSLLSDHVWLAGNALDTAVQHKGDLKDPQVVGAVKALDANSVALSKAIGSVYPDAEKPFLASWRQHIGFFVNYTLGKATKDDKQVAKAKADLDAYRTSFGQLINSVVPELPADAVADELKPHVHSLYAAIDASVAGKPDYQTKLSMAADHMVMTAEILAGGIAKNKGLEGDVDGMASTVRATLTSQLSASCLAGRQCDRYRRPAQGRSEGPAGRRRGQGPRRQLRGTGQDASDRSTPRPRSRSWPPGGNTSDSLSTTPWARRPRTTSRLPRPRLI